MALVAMVDGHGWTDRGGGWSLWLDVGSSASMLVVVAGLGFWERERRGRKRERLHVVPRCKLTVKEPVKQTGCLGTNPTCHKPDQF